MRMSKEMLRRYAAEFIGTFALVFFGCGTRDMIGDTQNFAGILVVHMAFALTVAAMIYTLSHISSAHFTPALTVGFTILVSGLLGNSLSGASMNPARSLAPAVFAAGPALATLWLYFVGPLIGAALGAIVYEVIRNDKYAKGVLEEKPTDEEMI